MSTASKTSNRRAHRHVRAKWQRAIRVEARPPPPGIRLEPRQSIRIVSGRERAERRRARPATRGPGRADHALVEVTIRVRESVCPPAGFAGDVVEGARDFIEHLRIAERAKIDVCPRMSAE